MTVPAEKGCKADASCLAHLFQNYFWLPTKLVFKIAPLDENFPLLLVERVSLFYKNILVSKGKVFQNSLNILPFHKESKFNPFSQLNFIQTLLMKRSKTSRLAKGMTKSLQKNKSFAFNQQSCFQTRDLWLSFVLKALISSREPNSFQKSTLSQRKKRIASDLLNKTIATRFYLHPFKKNKIWL